MENNGIKERLIRNINLKVSSIKENNEYKYVIDIANINIWEEFKSFFEIEVPLSLLDTSELRNIYYELNEFRDNFISKVKSPYYINILDRNNILGVLTNNNKDAIDLLIGDYGEFMHQLLIKYRFRKEYGTFSFIQSVYNYDSDDSAFWVEELNNSLFTSYSQLAIDLIGCCIYSDLNNIFPNIVYSDNKYCEYIKSKYEYATNIDKLHVLIAHVSIPIILYYLKFDENYILSAEDTDSWPWGNQNIVFKLYSSIKDFSMNDGVIRKANLIGAKRYKNMSIRQAECLKLFKMVLEKGISNLEREHSTV